jgi:hypothetical protein
MPTLDCSTGKAISVFPVSQATAKNKDGNGNKRKNRANSVSEQVFIFLNYFEVLYYKLFSSSLMALRNKLVRFILASLFSTVENLRVRPADPRLEYLKVSDNN